MSETVAEAKDRIRWLVKDRNPNRYAWDSLRLHRLMEHRLQEFAADIGLGVDRSGSFTLNDGEYERDLTDVTYGIAAWVPGGQVYQVILNYNRRPLAKWTPEQIDDAFIGQSPRSKGYPYAFSNSETSAGKPLIRVYPASLGTNTFIVAYRPIPAKFPIVPDAVVIGLEEPECRAYEKHVAIALVEGASDEELALVNLARSITAGWREDLYGTQDGRPGQIRKCAARRALELRSGTVLGVVP